MQVSPMMPLGDALPSLWQTSSSAFDTSMLSDVTSFWWTKIEVNYPSYFTNLNSTNKHHSSVHNFHGELSWGPYNLSRLVQVCYIDAHEDSIQCTGGGGSYIISHLWSECTHHPKNWVSHFQTLSLAVFLSVPMSYFLPLSVCWVSASLL